MKDVFSRQQRLAQRPVAEIPSGTIPTQLRRHLLNLDDTGNPTSLRGDRYEFWIYRQISKRLATGELAVDDSLRHRRFSDELVGVDRQAEILKNLDIPWLSRPVEAELDVLCADLDRRWLRECPDMEDRARLAGDQQNNALQTKALKAAGCRRLFEEAASGGRWDRPELHRLLDQLREGDTVVVWKLDRLSRSLKDVLHIMERIAKAGAGFRSITENIDTTTPAGRMMMQMVGAFAEFERAMIRERTSAGLAAARAEGRVGGRRKKLDPGKRKEIAESVISGRKSGAEMARLYNISAPTVSRIVARHRISPA